MKRLFVLFQSSLASLWTLGCTLLALFDIVKRKKYFVVLHHDLRGHKPERKEIIAGLGVRVIRELREFVLIIKTSIQAG